MPASSFRYVQIGGNVWYYDDLPAPAPAPAPARGHTQQRSGREGGRGIRGKDGEWEGQGHGTPTDWREHYYVCDGSGEDPLCQDRLPAATLHRPDHDLYVGHAMWCCNGTRWGNSSQASPAPAGCVFPFHLSTKRR